MVRGVAADLRRRPELRDAALPRRRGIAAQHQACVLDQRAGQRTALLLAARQFQRFAVTQRRQFQLSAVARTARSIPAAVLPMMRNGEAMLL